MKKIADIIKYAALITNQDQMILLGLKRGSTIWTNIGGRIEPNEKPIQCLQREIMEELACQIVLSPPPQKILEAPTTPTVDDPNKTVKIYWYKVEIIGTPVASNEIAEIKWVNPLHIDIEVSPQIKEYLLPYIKNSI